MPRMEPRLTKPMPGLQSVEASEFGCAGRAKREPDKGWLVRQAPMIVMIAGRPRQPLNSLTSRLNFSGFSMNMKCAPPSFSSKISVFAPLICFPIQT